MHTIVRDASTDKPDFVFYADRLLRLVRCCTLMPEGAAARTSNGEPCHASQNAHAQN